MEKKDATPDAATNKPVSAQSQGAAGPEAASVHAQEVCKKASLTCGIIMPISGMPECPEDHWGDVYRIVQDAVDDAGFVGDLVSNAEDASIIHRTIVNKLYSCDIVVCDVSCKNPNVMFELGMRLAFDKPVVIIKDFETLYTFDVGPIEHIGYPRSLHFHKMTEFKKSLAAKVKSTFMVSKSKGYTSFLKSFGDMHAVSMGATKMTSDQVILEYMETMSSQMRQLRHMMMDVARVQTMPHLQSAVPPSLANINKAKGLGLFNPNISEKHLDQRTMQAIANLEQLVALADSEEEGEALRWLISTVWEQGLPRSPNQLNRLFSVVPDRIRSYITPSEKVMSILRSCVY